MSASAALCQARCADSLAVWLALAHDAYKLSTPGCLWPHHYGHELCGEKLVAVWAAKLGLGDDFCEAGCFTAHWHKCAARYALMRPGKKFKLLALLGDAFFAQALWKVVDADSKSAISAMAEKDFCPLAQAKKAGLSEQRQIELLGRQ